MHEADCSAGALGDAFVQTNGVLVMGFRDDILQRAVMEDYKGIGVLGGFSTTAAAARPVAAGGR
jgi:hypothetical protein